MGLKITFPGAEGAASALRELGERFNQPPGPLFQSLSAEWTTAFQANVREQRSPDGTPFALLALMTQRLRKWRGFAPDRPILVRTGDLMASIRELERGESTLVVGTRDPRSEVLQFGGPWSANEDVPGTRKIPPRPFVGFTAQDVEDLTATIAEYFVGGDSPGGAPEHA